MKGPEAIGCAAIIGGLVGLPCLALLLLTDAGLQDSLMISGLLWGIFFVASLILGLRDWLRESIQKRDVRRRLLQRSPASDDVAAMGVSQEHLATFLATRRLIAEFFDVQEDRLRADDRLDRDYSYLALEPVLNDFVMERAMAGQETRVPTWQFELSGLETLADFARAVDLQLEELKDGTL